MTTKTFNNSIVISSAKGNLVKDPVGPFTSASGREYMAFTVACNHINKNEEDTWYPRVFLFGECMSVATTLKKGDFIEISHALLNPSSVQPKWIDEDGNKRPQADALMVFTQKTNNGINIPVRVLRRKSLKKIKGPSKDQIQEAVEQNVSIAEEAMISIEEETILQALISE